MNPLALEWVDKAEGDYATACREMRARLALNYDAVCFHSQQMAEKYLKAVLLGHSQPIPRIHSLADLLLLCMRVESGYQLLQPDLNVLENYAVQFRYPGQSAEKLDAKEAIRAAKAVRAFIRKKLGLEL